MNAKHLEECVAHNKHYCVISSSSSNEHCFIEGLFQFYMCVYIIYIDICNICICIMGCKVACISCCVFQLKCSKATNLSQFFHLIDEED